MNLKRFIAFSGLILAIVLPQFAAALSYCPKPNGIATRDVAHDYLMPLFGLVNERFGSNKTFVFVVKVPPQLQLEKSFTTRENEELLRQAPLNPDFHNLVVETREAMKAKGHDVDDATISKLLIKEMSKPRSEESIKGDGLIYLFSNNKAILESLSPDIADNKGLVIEGSIAETLGLLGAADSKSMGWWESLLKQEIDTVVAIGFDANKEIRKFTGKDTYLLKIADWQTATEKGLSRLANLLDVPPEKASVINLFPISQEHVDPWGFSTEQALQYVNNGKKFENEYTRLGYNFTPIQPTLSPGEVIARIEAAATAGKKILLIAETGILPDGNSIVRLPGRPDGLLSSHFDAMSSVALENLFIISCNSQSVSKRLPLSTIGTIYTDKANDLVRLTFAAAQADTLSNFLQTGLKSNRGWFEATGRIASDLFNTENNQATVTFPDGIKVTPVATISQVIRQSSAVTQQAEPVENSAVTAAAETPSDNRDESMQHNLLIIFLTGFLGALCREGIRWKRLVEQKKAQRYVRLPYVLVSAALVIAAGFVAIIFSKLVHIENLILPIAFVSGVGFEKIVKLAAELKLWNPLKPVPMGGSTSSKDMDTTHSDLTPRESVLDFLRHGE